METIRLPDNTLDKCFKPIKETYTPYLNRGFAIVLARLAQTQLSYSFFEQIDGFHKTHPFDDITIYSVNNELPCVSPPTSIYPVGSLGEHIGPVIATCPLTWNIVNSAYADIKRYYYLYDPIMLRFLNPLVMKNVASSDFTFVLRSKDHLEICQLAGINKNKISDIYCPNAEPEILNQITRKS